MRGQAVNMTSVAIVGGGPNGVTLANLLGVYGIATVVIEKSAAPYYERQDEQAAVHERGDGHHPVYE